MALLLSLLPLPLLEAAVVSLAQRGRGLLVVRARLASRVGNELHRARVEGGRVHPLQGTVLVVDAHLGAFWPRLI